MVEWEVTIPAVQGVVDSDLTIIVLVSLGSVGFNSTKDTFNVLS